MSKTLKYIAIGAVVLLIIAWIVAFASGEGQESFKQGMEQGREVMQQK